jgi:hypothetical protein
MSTTKQFIGRTYAHTFSNGDIALKLTLTEDELSKLLQEARNNKTGVTVETKKSQKGSWYSEISPYAPKPQQHPEPSTGDDNVQYKKTEPAAHTGKAKVEQPISDDDLPF